MSGFLGLGSKRAFLQDKIPKFWVLLITPKEDAQMSHSFSIACRGGMIAGSLHPLPQWIRTELVSQNKNDSRQIDPAWCLPLPQMCASSSCATGSTIASATSEKLQNHINPNIFSPRCVYDGTAILYLLRELPLVGGDTHMVKRNCPSSLSRIGSLSRLTSPSLLRASSVFSRCSVGKGRLAVSNAYFAPHHHVCSAFL